MDALPESDREEAPVSVEANEAVAAALVGRAEEEGQEEGVADAAAGEGDEDCEEVVDCEGVTEDDAHPESDMTKDSVGKSDGEAEAVGVEGGEEAAAEREEVWVALCVAEVQPLGEAVELGVCDTLAQEEAVGDTESPAVTEGDAVAVEVETGELGAGEAEGVMLGVTLALLQPLPEGVPLGAPLALLHAEAEGVLLGVPLPLLHAETDTVSVPLMEVLGVLQGVGEMLALGLAAPDTLLLGHWDDVGDSLGVLPPLALLQAVSVKPLEVGMGV